MGLRLGKQINTEKRERWFWKGEGMVYGVESAPRAEKSADAFRGIYSAGCVV